MHDAGVDLPGSNTLGVDVKSVNAHRSAVRHGGKGRTLMHVSDGMRGDPGLRCKWIWYQKSWVPGWAGMGRALNWGQVSHAKKT